MLTLLPATLIIHSSIRVSANKFFRYNYSTFSSIYLMDTAVVSARKKPLTPKRQRSTRKGLGLGYVIF